ncbi:conserved hypothetical protein [Histoplasma mississippiense (nom. inval.)]|uniref:conserved hypothetical protein n=1 Tax=Ajellomyces capsulatus (strain NAm1 / WU24) TaxID=2059318 RepID=UPI000157C1F4|nr:conserved hypothetical protein [Histoplasma mississippiense (nom. inval.)]EDN07181.1 conserved hypothetical protein [Histoplasma mississippiense (nom. inval.)]
MQTLYVTSGDDDFFHRQHEKPPTSALEHFEAATRKEAQGNLGSSLDLYRKAYRLDSNVDQEYRKKHFPQVMSVPSINPSAQLVTVPKPAHISQEKPGISTAELISSFAACPILGAGPTIEDEPPPPCPISRVPSEVLVEILWHVALLDPAAFGRLSSVCKRMAYHFAHEQHIWRRLCQGSEFGFGAMHYDFACDNISWNTPIHIVTYYRYLRFYPDGSVISLLTTTEPVDVVRYISKKNLETLHVGTHSHRRHQHHTSDSAQAVVPVANPIPPVAATTLKSCLRGRWHLNNPYPAPPESEQSEALPSAPLMTSTSTPAANHTSSPSKLHQAAPAPTSTSGNESLPDPRDLFIETEGVDPKYTYTMHLALRSASGGRPVGENTASPSNPSKNTKLMWKGFWSYNRLTDDWAEFGLRNDRAFVFRRVRGWGMG